MVIKAQCVCSSFHIGQPEKIMAADKTNYQAQPCKAPEQVSNQIDMVSWVQQ